MHSHAVTSPPRLSRSVIGRVRFPRAGRRDFLHYGGGTASRQRQIPPGL
jgi:hypothetical protein